MMEFQPEHEKYRQLTKKLRDVYNKDVFEVSAFLNECEERYLYAAGQLDELSKQYIEVKRYGLRKGEIVKEKNSLMDAMEYYSDHEKIKEGTFTGGMNYVASKGSEYVMFTTRSVYRHADGKQTIYYNIDVYDSKGNKIDTVTDYNDDHFDKKIKEFQDKYGFEDCYTFNDYNSARSFAKNNCTEDKNNVMEKSVESTQKSSDDTNISGNGEKYENNVRESSSESRVDITIDKHLLKNDENGSASVVKTRVPGTWGENVRYLWIDKNDIMSINQDKTILTHLDKNKGYELYDENDRLAMVMSGEELYSHYDKVERASRYKNEKGFRK
jgi:hypothetical protein